MAAGGSAFTGSAASSAGVSPVRAALAQIPGLGQLAWPFPGGYRANEIRRIDEGQDLQFPGVKPVPVLAVAPGTVTTFGPDPSGFGVSYPGETLAHPIGGFRQIYYGHILPIPGQAGKYVKAGQPIGYTMGPTSGGDAAGTPNWLEVGFFPPSWANGPAMAALLARLRGARAQAAAVRPAPPAVIPPNIRRPPPPAPTIPPALRWPGAPGSAVATPTPTAAAHRYPNTPRLPGWLTSRYPGIAPVNVNRRLPGAGRGRPARPRPAPAPSLPLLPPVRRPARHAAPARRPARRRVGSGRMVR